MFGRNKSGPANPVRYIKDPSGQPAVDLGDIEKKGHVSLSKEARTVGVSLQKRGLAGMRGRVVVVLDHSGSMHGDYNSGAVQTLLERTLGFGLQIDTDGEIEVIPFDSRVWPTTRVGVGNYQQAAQSIWKPNKMGGTDLTAALKTVKNMAADTKEIIVCIVITDGEPNDSVSATEAVCELARYPVFLKFVGLRRVAYLDYLDKLEDHKPNARLIDNVNSQTVSDPSTVTAERFAEQITEEWDGWLTAAAGAGVIHV